MPITSKYRGWSNPLVLPTGLFIREYLLKHREAYPQEIWRELKKAREEIFGVKGRKLYVGSYDSFRRNYIYVLKQLGLIEEVREEKPRNPKWYRRKIVRITPGREDDLAWINPQKEFKLKRYGYYKYKEEKKKR